VGKWLGGEMAQTMYAHMNEWIKKFLKNEMSFRKKSKYLKGN
jgi:hypothetical protein